VKIHTTLGEMDEADLVKAIGVVENENEHTEWVEYRCDGVLVHRSAHITLKKSPKLCEAVAADFA